MPWSHPATDLALLTFLHISPQEHVRKVMVCWALLAKGRNGQADEMSIITYRAQVYIRSTFPTRTVCSRLQAALPVSIDDSP